MTRDHLSDEAIAAVADDVLTGRPRERARKHISCCPECNYAVAVQREAVWALRAAPAPSLPSGLLDRLRDVPVTTPVTRIPAAMDEDGTAMFSTVSGPAAALVAAKPAHPTAGQTGKSTDRHRRGRTLAVATTSAVVVTAAVVGGVLAMESGSPHDPANHQTHVTSRPGTTPGAQVAGVIAPMHW